MGLQFYVELASLFEKITIELTPESISQLTNNDIIDKEVRKIFIKYKKDYTTEKDVKDSVEKMITEIKNLIGYRTKPTEDPKLY